MFLRKIFLIIGMIIIFVSCSMEEDEDAFEDQAVIRFEYETTGNYMGDYFGVIYPVRFFHTNPICEGMPNPSTYYKTEPGQYYLEYVLRNNKSYYIIYTIEIWKVDMAANTDSFMIDGEVKLVEGKFKKFEIDLSYITYYFAPRWDDDYYVDGVSMEPIRGEIPSRSVIPPGRNVGPLFGRIKQEQEGGSMTVEYGILYEE